jgi:hypothetical protein
MKIYFTINRISKEIKAPLLLMSLLIFVFTSQMINAQLYTYSGEVKFHAERIEIAFGGGSDSGYDWNVNVDEKWIINATFFTRFSGTLPKLPSGMPLMFKLTTIDAENFEFENSASNEGNEQKISQVCYDESARFSHKATPGDSRFYKKGVRSSVIETDKPIIEGGVLSFHNNKYTISLMGKFKYRVEGIESTGRKLACSDTELTPSSLSFDETLEFPMGISGNGTIENPEVIAGFFTPVDISNTDCRNCTGSLSDYVHGDIECAFINKIDISWSLTRTCDVSGTVKEELDDRDIPESTKERIKNVMNKLEDPSVDPNVFISATNIREVYLIKQSDKVLDIKNGYMVNLRELFNEYCEKYGGDKKNLTDLVIMTDKEIVRIIRMFNEYYRRENMLTVGQVRIKDYIADQQQNLESVYSCYSGI